MWPPCLDVGSIEQNVLSGLIDSELYKLLSTHTQGTKMAAGSFADLQDVPQALCWADSCSATHM